VAPVNHSFIQAVPVTMLQNFISRVSTELLFWSATVTIMLADDAAMLAIAFS
jgi:hypothetical protein